MRAPLWLAHHHGEGLARCWKVGGLHLCARCSGLMPALLGSMVLEAWWPLTLPLRVALALEVLLLVPGLWDVLRDQGDLGGGWLGSNGVRTLSGLGLGLALGHAASVFHAGGWSRPEALLPLLSATVATLWFLDLDRGRRRRAAVAGPAQGELSGEASGGVQLTDGRVCGVGVDSGA